MATIEKRGDSYRITASGGYDIEGRQIRRRITWTPNSDMTERQLQKELNRQAILFEERVKNGLYLDASVRFCEFTDLWIKEYAEKQLAPRTIDSYRFYLKRLNQAIGHIRLDKLQPHHIIEFYNSLAEENIRADVKYKSAIDLASVLKDKHLTRRRIAEISGLAIGTVERAVAGYGVAKQSAEAVCKALSLRFKDAFAPTGKTKLTGTSISQYHRLLSSILSTAVKWQVIVQNPAERVQAPRKEREEAVYLDEDQAALLIKRLEKEPIQYKAAVILLIYSGMRRGELLGLEWNDFDFKKYIVSITRTSQYLSKKGVFTTKTKTTSSVRVIKLPAVAFNLLMELKVRQAEERIRLGNQWQETDRLFTMWNGAPMHPDTISSWFRDFIKHHSDLPQIHLHSLRHTNATLLIAAGTNVRTVSRRLGHSQTSTTMDIYSHAIQSADAAAADALGDILDPLKKKQAHG